MFDEENFTRLFREEYCTTPDQKDPRKPVILQGDMLSANPEYNAVLVDREQREAEIERRKTQCGTSFFLNFDPVCNLHQVQGHDGDLIRQQIREQLRERFLVVFVSQFPADDPPPYESLNNALQVAICPRAQVGFNNGEAYLWIRKLKLKEDFVFTFLRAFREFIENNPVIVESGGETYEVQFYGWGFRYF